MQYKTEYCLLLATTKYSFFSNTNNTNDTNNNFSETVLCLGIVQIFSR